MGYFEGFYGVDWFDCYGLFQLGDGFFLFVVVVYVGECVGVFVVVDWQVVGLVEGVGEVLFYFVGVDFVGYFVDQFVDFVDYFCFVVVVECQGEWLVGLFGQESVQFFGYFVGIVVFEYYWY